MELLCTYFVSGIRYHGGQEISFHRVFSVTHTDYVDAVWASNWIQEELEKRGGSVVFSNFNMVGAPQEVGNDSKV